MLRDHPAFMHLLAKAKMSKEWWVAWSFALSLLCLGALIYSLRNGFIVYSKRGSVGVYPRIYRKDDPKRYWRGIAVLAFLAIVLFSLGATLCFKLPNGWYG
jgi:hypothetical protein